VKTSNRSIGWAAIVAAVLLGLTVATGLSAAPPSGNPAAAPSAGKGAPKLRNVTLAIRHRVFHEFADQQAVELNKDFLVGDTKLTARVVQYVPDFTMDLSTGKVISRSQEPRNPAFKIVVREGKAYRDTTWAMLSLPPHFARNSYLAFKVMRIDFIGREPLVADSAQAYKELEALKEAARKMRTTEADPHGGAANPHGGMSSPHGGAANPHGAPAASPHGTTPPGHPSTIPMVPSHGDGSQSTEDKDSK
jgi:hypothetical protein